MEFFEGISGIASMTNIQRDNFVKRINPFPFQSFGYFIWVIPLLIHLKKIIYESINFFLNLSELYLKFHKNQIDFAQLKFSFRLECTFISKQTNAILF